MVPNVFLIYDIHEVVIPTPMILDYISQYTACLETVVRPYFLEVSCCAIRCNAMRRVMIVASDFAGILDTLQLRGALSLPVQDVMAVGLRECVTVVPVTEFVIGIVVVRYHHPHIIH